MRKKIIIAGIAIIVILIVVYLLVLPNANNEDGSDIVVFSPKPNQLIANPLSIEGKARGFWYFEASFPVKLTDKDGNVLASGIAQAQSDPATGEVNWMTENFVNFKAELNFISDKNTDGFLVLQKDNPSGLPENDAEIKIPVLIPKIETMKVSAYFNNSRMDPEFSCNKVFPIERIILKTQAIARAAIEELLKGPTETEKSQDFFTSINSRVKIQGLVIEGGVAKIDFDEQMEFQVGGSCRVSAIRSQIIETLKQFSTVKSVVISINGRIEDILQP
jgi:hypothetical protein